MREVKDERPGVLHVGMPLGKYLRRYCPADWQFADSNGALAFCTCQVVNVSDSVAAG